MTGRAGSMGATPAKLALRQLLVGLVLLVLLAVSARGAEASLSKLLDAGGVAQGLLLLRGLLRPDVSAAFIERVLALMLESLAIGALGLVVALALGAPLALLAARVPGLRQPPRASRWLAIVRGTVRWLARSLLSALRAVPEIVWAFLFVRIFGLGPGPAVLAIGLSFGGILGKLYAELIDACDPVPIRALEAAGASRWAILLHAVWPQVRTQWLGYGLFRWECSIRSAAILGVVGAGGIGSEIELSIRYFQYDKLATALLALLACVALMELSSAALRRRRDGVRLALGVLAAVSAGGVMLLDIDWASLWSEAALQQCIGFVRGFLPPETAAAAVTKALWLMLQTLAMAAFATALAAMAAAIVAPFASRVLTVSGFLRHAPRPRGVLSSLLMRGVLMAARGLLQLFRALPELVWALLFVVWVGAGPFAGTLAIAAHTFGILGRLFGEIYEDAESQHAKPPRVLEAAGCSRWSTWLHGVLPQCAPQLAAFTLFRFEVNVRATAMVGFVGAGGIGDSIHTAISLFHMHDLAMLLLILLAAVIAIDMLGEALRRRLTERR